MFSFVNSDRFLCETYKSIFYYRIAQRNTYNAVQKQIWANAQAVPKKPCGRFVRQYYKQAI